MSDRTVYDLSQPEQLIIFIVRHQAALGLESRELETLLHLALHAARGEKTPFMVMASIIATETGKTYRQVCNRLQTLKERGFVTLPSDRRANGTRSLPYYTLAPLVAMIAKLEGWVTHDE